LAKRNKSSLTIIFVTVFIDLVGFGILIPILPTFATKEIHISDFQIGIVVAIYSFMQFLFNPIMGKVSDKIGRKPVIIFSLFLNSVSYVIFAFTNSFLLLLFSRVIAGIGGSNIGVAQAYIADITSKHNRSKGMGVIGAAFGLGFVFGPLIGGMLSKYGYEVVGFLAAGFSFLAFLFALFILPESLHKDLRISHTSYKVFDLKSAIEVMKMPRVGFLVFLFFIWPPFGRGGSEEFQCSPFSSLFHNEPVRQNSQDFHRTSGVPRFKKEGFTVMVRKYSFVCSIRIPDNSFQSIWNTGKRHGARCAMESRCF
jgi:multidrug resistance protein